MAAQAQLSDLEILDTLIATLDELIAEAEEAPLVISASDPSRRASYRPIGNAAANSDDRKPKPAEAVFLADGKLILRCAKTEAVRLMPVEAAIIAGKTGRGETTVLATGIVTGLKRISGGYDVEVRVDDSRRIHVTPGQKLREFVEKANAAGWNRWCQDIRDAIDLSGVDMAGTDLSGYDLCCADLSGANLSGCDLSNAILAGADLAKTKLDNVKVAGTDFFRARMSRRHAGLLPLSGMPEQESVIFAEEADAVLG